MNNTERQLVIAQLSAGKSIEDAAAALVQYRAEQEVRPIAQELERAATSQARTRRLYWYPFLSPKPAPVKVRDAEGVQMWQQGQRQEYRVRLPDLEAFCAERGLDVQAMTAVGDGIRKEHKGWIRAPFQGGSTELGKTYEEPRKPKATQPQQPVQQVQTLFAAPPIAYKPAN
jgi:hypothetical protein